MPRHLMPRHPALSCLLLAVSLGACTGSTGAGEVDAGPAQCDESAQSDLYANRIEPLISNEHTQSCNACHLSGLDLTAFVKDTPCETMACLEASDMVSFDDPASSPILELIARGFDAPQTTGITSESVQAEYDGFLAWIAFSASCHDETCADVVSDCVPLEGDGPDAGPPPDAGAPKVIIQRCSTEDLVHTFEERIWRWRGRCDLCHVEGAALSDIGEPPPWMVYAYEEDAARKTYNNIVQAGYIDETCPLQSPFLLKPLDEEVGGIEHGGGSKFHDPVEDEGYADWLLFVRKYARCHGYEGEPGTVEDGSCF